MTELILRLKLAWAVLLGKVKHDDGKWFCSRQHATKEKIIVDEKRLFALERSADDLKTAVGFIGQAGKHPEYLKVLDQNRK